MRLPKEQAFAKARELAQNNPKTTAFYRFADFETYYPQRLKADDTMHEAFVALGGKPEEKHPLSFVLNGSEFLHKWFGYGSAVRIPLADIPSEQISFTYGDSVATMTKTGRIPLITKEALWDEIVNHTGTLEEYIRSIEHTFHYIEAQVWCDAIVNGYHD